MRQFRKIKMHDCRLWTAVYIASLAATMTIGDHGSGDDWNSLPAAVRDSLSLLCFRRRLKDISVSIVIRLLTVSPVLSQHFSHR